MVQITKSTRAVTEKEVERNWHLIDMKNKVLGREIPVIASHLQGKLKVNYVPYLDTGDHVVVINVQNLKVTGKKASEKEYIYYSGYPGGQKTVSFQHMKANNPTEIVRHALTGMLPKNKHRDARLARLHIYAGPDHPFQEKFTKNS